MMSGMAASIMSGESSDSTFIINMCNCISKTGDGVFKIDDNKLKTYLGVLYGMWPALEDYNDILNSHKVFRLEECFYTIANKDPSIFDGTTRIDITYPDREVYIFIRDGKDLLDVYAEATSRGRDVDVQYKSKNISVIKERQSTSVIDTERHYLCIGCTCMPKRGVSVPAGINLVTPIVLRDNKLKTPIIVSENGDIEIHGSVVIEAQVPIIADGVKSVMIKGDGNLTLICTEDMQPCIGTVTNTGMSYGRWSPSGTAPDEINIDGVKVVCGSKVENFAVGSYGVEKVPTINVINNGKIVCPEMEGERIVIRQAKAPDGSTKISERMEYGIFKKGMLEEDMIKPEVKAYMYGLPKEMQKYVNYKTQQKNVEEALRLCKLNPNLDVSLVLDGTKRLPYSITAAILHNNEIYNDHEFHMETNKIEYLIGKYSDKTLIDAERGEVHAESIICCLIIGVHDALGVHISDYAYEVLFEMIPSYFFNGWVNGDKSGSVNAHIQENISTRKLLGQIRNNLKISEFIKDMDL